MKKFIPDFIQKKFVQKERVGALQAYVLQLDIVGFTTLTAKAMEYDVEGAELIAEYLNDIFSVMIDQIHGAGGFVSVFQGDGFVAIFPQEHTVLRKIVDCASAIITYTNTLSWSIKNTTPIKTSVCTCLSYGSIVWELIENPRRHTWFFYGDPIINAALGIECNLGGMLLCDEAFYECMVAQNLNIETQKHQSFHIVEFIPQQTDFSPSLRKISFHSQPELKLFFPELSEIQQIHDEYRLVVSCFVQILEAENAERIINEIINISDEYQVFLNKIDVVGSYLTLMLLVGAPTAVEKPVHKAAELALSIIRLDPINLRITLVQGITFTGVIGSPERCDYTVLGTSVNHAARLLNFCNWGSILLNQSTAEQIDHEYETTIFDKHKIRGFATEQITYRLLNRKPGMETNCFLGDFIGRMEEISRINTFIAMLGGKRESGLINLFGLAGIGKSRVIQKVMEQSQLEPWLKLHLNCDSVLKRHYNIANEILSQYLTLRHDDPPEMTKIMLLEKIETLRTKHIDHARIYKIESNLDELCRYYDFVNLGTSEDELNLHFEGFSVLEVIKNILLAEAEVRPLILAVDNLQWIDYDLLNIVKELLQDPAPKCLTIIASTRLSHIGHRAKQRLTADKQLNINLGSFNNEEALKLIDDRIKVFNVTLSSSLCSKDIYDSIVRLADGNPLFLEQLLLYLKSSFFRKHQSLDPAHLFAQLPNSLHQTILARYDSFDDALKELCIMAAIWGNSFYFHDLAILYKKTSFNSDEPFYSVFARGVSNSLWHAEEEMIYVFNHQIIREALYSTILKRKLRDLHLLAAEIVISRCTSKYTDQQLLEIAHHYALAEAWLPASRFTYMAVLQFRKQNRYKTALSLVQKAINYVTKAEQCNADIVQLRIIEAYLHSDMGETDAYHNCIQKLESFFKGDEYEAYRSRIHLLKAHYYFMVGDFHEAIRFYQICLEDIPTIDPKEMLEITNYIGRAYIKLSDFDKAEYYLMLAMDLCDSSNSKLLASLHNHLGIVCNARGEVQQALKHFETTLIIAESSSDLDQQLNAKGNIGICYKLMGEISKATQAFEQQLEFATELEDINYMSMGYGNLSEIHMEANNFAKALYYTECFEELLRKLKDRTGLAHSLNSKALMHAELGNFARAKIEIKEMFRINKRMGIKILSAFGCFTLALVDKRSRKLRSALQNILVAITIGEETLAPFYHYGFYTVLSEIQYELGDLSEALETAQRVIEGALDSGRDDAYVDAIILRAKIRIRTNTHSIQDTLAALDNLLEKVEDQEQIAYLAYTIYTETRGAPGIRLSHEMDYYADLALSKLNAISQLVDKYEYRIRLSDLKQSLISSEKHI